MLCVLWRTQQLAQYNAPCRGLGGRGVQEPGRSCRASFLDITHMYNEPGTHVLIAAGAREGEKPQKRPDRDDAKQREETGRPTDRRAMNMTPANQTARAHAPSDEPHLIQSHHRQRHQRPKVARLRVVPQQRIAEVQQLPVGEAKPEHPRAAPQQGVPSGHDRADTRRPKTARHARGGGTRRKTGWGGV